MSLDKHGMRCMLEEFFTDYGPHQQFELDIDHDIMTITAISERGHPLKKGQKSLGGL